MEPEKSDEPARVLFIYWGRRGFTRFALEVGRAAVSNAQLDASISISRQNENFAAFSDLGSRLLAIDTFATNVGALTQAWRVPLLRQRLLAHLAERRIQAVIELMPHVWSSFILPSVKQAGVRYATIVHDAETHPGDYRSSSVRGLVGRSIAQADVVFTLSKSVSQRLVANGIPASRQVQLFLPDLDFGGGQLRQPPKPGEPVRLAFLGRIMPYKGLPLFLDTVELLRRAGVAVEFGVFGEGALGQNAGRLEAMGAEVVNRWVTEAEIAAVLQRFHALMLSHIEASQSGIVATAFGAGLPVIATPVGGLIEQVEDGETGTLAQRVDASALAEAAKRLLLDAQLYSHICRRIASTKPQRSVSRFVEICARHATQQNP